MPKVKKTAVKVTKQKLSKEQRSDVAKARWAKRREAVAPQDATQASELTASGLSVQVELDGGKTLIPAPLDTLLDNAVANAPEGADRIDIVSEQGSVLASREIQPPPPAAPPVEAPVAQLTPVAPKRQKRYTGPKEFSVALKAAEGRLAKAIVERAQAAGQLAALQAEIPSLLQIIAALKGQQNIPAAPYDISAQFSVPVAPQFQPYVDPLAAIQAAQPIPPVSRASGGAIQFGPEVLGALEGPEDDADIDRFITGPAAGGSGWIGG
jgi:hypothetical protein